MPEVTARKSRYSYGISVDRMIKDLRDFDAAADMEITTPEGDWITSRMHWYLRKVREDRKMGEIEFGLIIEY